MRTRNALERLEAAGRPLLAEVESLVDVAEEGRILERILAAASAGRSPRATRGRAALALVGRSGRCRGNRRASRTASSRAPIPLRLRPADTTIRSL